MWGARDLPGYGGSESLPDSLGATAILGAVIQFSVAIRRKFGSMGKVIHNVGHNYCAIIGFGLPAEAP